MQERKKPVGANPNPAERHAMILKLNFEDANRLLLERESNFQRGNNGTETATPSAEPEPKQEQPAPQIKRAPIVILCIAGRYLDIYSKDRLELQFLNVPDSVDGLRAEDYVETLLPRRYRDQLFPGYIRARFEAEKLSPSTVSERVARSESIQRLRAEGKVFTGAELQRIICGGRQ
jgi:hypothetical protein